MSLPSAAGVSVGGFQLQLGPYKDRWEEAADWHAGAGTPGEDRLLTSDKHTQVSPRNPANDTLKLKTATVSDFPTNE